MIPFFAFYSMFGFQRIGDLVWAAADAGAKGFMMGGTAGRTTLNGEGLQHQDGHSHVLAGTVPSVKSYDPAFAYELAVIIQHGLERMYTDGETWIYYITMMNENYPMPAMPEDAAEGIIRGMYHYKHGDGGPEQPSVQLLASGTIMLQALEARRMLQEDYGVSAEIYSVTSWNELYRDAIGAARWNRLNPGKEQRKPYVATTLDERHGPVIAATDYVKSLPNQLAQWVPGGIHALGTDGFGRSDTREVLRDFFEVDARAIVVAALYELLKRGEVKEDKYRNALKELDYDTSKPDPLYVGIVSEEE
jgi:pyruvate dehydrogenase E1 component